MGRPLPGAVDTKLKLEKEELIEKKKEERKIRLEELKQLQAETGNAKLIAEKLSEDRIAVADLKGLLDVTDSKAVNLQAKAVEQSPV